MPRLATNGSGGAQPPPTWKPRLMDLFEYQGKQYFARFGIPIAAGGVADTVDEAVAQAEQIGYPVVVKAQVQVGGRGKAGGIKLASSADEVRQHAANILGMDIRGHTVRRVWIERASDIAREYYASFTLDRGARKHLGMVSARGGVDIEQVAAEDPPPSPACTSTPLRASPRPTPARSWTKQASTQRPNRVPYRS
jgi:succinyl-CoA synthetase beta subunit